MRRALGGLLLLAACGAPLPEGAAPVLTGPAVPALADDTCGAAPYAPLVGQPATALERELIMRQVRLVRASQPVSTDLRPGRISFAIDTAERIARIYCG